MTKRQFLDLIEDVPDDTKLVLLVGDSIVDVCGLSETIDVKDCEGNIDKLFLIEPCACHEEEDDLIDDFESLLEEEIIEPVFVDEINLN